MRTLLLLLLLALPAASARAQTNARPAPARRVTVHLRKGEAVAGTFLRADAKAVYVEADGEQLAIALDEVASLVFPRPEGEEEESPAAKAVAALKSLLEVAVRSRNSRDYGNRFLEVKALVDDQLPLIPEGGLREAVSDTLKGLELVSEIWSQAPQTPGDETGKMTTDAMTTTLTATRRRLEEAEKLLDKRP